MAKTHTLSGTDGVFVLNGIPYPSNQYRISATTTNISIKPIGDGNENTVLNNTYFGDIKKSNGDSYSSTAELVGQFVQWTKFTGGFSSFDRDAFGRSRISNPETLIDTKQLFDSLPLFYDDKQVSGTGTTSTFVKRKAATEITVAANTAGKRVRQTRIRPNYQPGKSQLCIFTAKMAIVGNGQGIKAEVGLHDDNNGMCFRLHNGVYSLVIKSDSTGSYEENVINSDNWNIDKLDGKGLSGKQLQNGKTQIMFIDYEWLGVGTVAYGFIINRIPIYVHYEHHSNIREEVYMSTPNLPIRYSIENDGTGAETTLDHICSTVISEGGSQITGTLRYSSTNGTFVNCASEGVIYAILGMRLKTTHIGAGVKLEKAALQVQNASKNGEWFFAFNPTISGTFNYIDDVNSSVKIARGDGSNVVTEAGIIQTSGGFIESSSGGGGSGGTSTPISNSLLIGSDIDDNTDQVVLCFRPNGGTSNIQVEASIARRELN